MNSRSSGDVEVGAGVALASIGEYIAALTRIFELVDTFRQVPCYSAGASFLVQGSEKCLLLKSGSARVALVRFTLVNDASRWTLSFPNLNVVPHVVGNLTVWFDPAFPTYRRSWDTQPNCEDSFSTATDPFPPLFFDFSLG